MVSSKFRNKILDREKYYSDKEINYIHVLQKKINHEKYGMSKEGIHVFQKKINHKKYGMSKEGKSIYRCYFQNNEESLFQVLLKLYVK